MPKIQTVAVLGASPKPERYSNKAVRLLKQKGHRVIPIHPAIEEIESLPVAPNLKSLAMPPDTLTVYVNPETGTKLAEDIIAARPGRVILNPGTESPELERKLNAAGIKLELACTLVLLRTGKF
jgi:predicted CoA-binding protein